MKLFAAGVVMVVVAAAEPASAQDRVRRSIAGPLTQEAVTRALVLAPENAGDPGGPAELSLEVTISFEFNSAKLTPHARQELNAVAASLRGPELAGVQLILEGHTDATGSADYNLRLSQQRADAVVAYLTFRGVSRDRLRASGYGEYRLLREYAPTDDRQRRVEIVRTF